MSVQKLNIVDIDLNSGNIHRSWNRHSIGTADNQANAFGVRVFRDGVPEDLTGVSVQGYFRDPRGNNIAITSGNTVEGNTAYVVLPQACYNYEGQFALAIKLIGGGVTGTVRIVDGMVDNTHTGGAVAPTEAVPTYQEILATYDDMVDIVEDYEEVVANQDAKISDLESAVDKQDHFDYGVANSNTKYSFPLKYQLGTLNDSTGQESYHANRYRTPYIDIGSRNFIVDNIPSAIQIYVFRYDSGKTFLGATSAGVKTRTVYSSKPSYIRIVFAPIDSAETLLIEDCKKVTVSLPSIEIENKNIINIPLEGGKFTSGVTSYSRTDYSGNRRSAYFIKTNGATGFLYDEVAQYTNSYVTVYCYNASFEYIGYEEKQMSAGKYIPVKTNTEYIRFFFATSEKIENINIMAVDSSEPPELIKNVAIARTDPYEFLTFKLDADSCATARLMLPPNYTPTGEKVPLILWLDGSGNFAVWGGGFTSAKLPYLYYLRDEGFAILSVFGWSNTMLAKYSNCGRAYPYPVPTCMKCLKIGLQYVFDRYNIDPDEVHIMSKSQGGQCSLYFASYPIVPGLKSIGMFSPVLDYLSMPGESTYADTRKAIADDVGFTGDTDYFGSTDFLSYSTEARAFFAQNIDALTGMNEAWTSLVGGLSADRLTEAIDDSEAFWTGQLWQYPNTTNYYDSTDRAKIAKVPVKIWGSSDDADTPYRKMVEIVAQLKNGGSEAVLETLPRGTGDHSCADMPPSGVNRIASVTTALGYTYTDIPVGWVENIEWIRLHMSK